jgi:hypothetical protein
MAEFVRPLSSFTPAEQRLILALIAAEDAPPKVEMTPDQAGRDPGGGTRSRPDRDSGL